MKVNYTIQSNDITTSRNILNIYERRVLNVIIQNVSDQIKSMAMHRVKAIDYYPDAGDPTALVMEFKANQIVKHDRYEELREALVKLKTTAIYIEKKNGTRLTGFLNWAEFDRHSEFVKISIDKVFYQTLFNLSSGYTIFQATVLNSLTSVYATKIYEILAKFRDQGFAKLSIEELRRLTNTEDVYGLYSNFKSNVLLVAQKQLDNNKLTDIRFTFKEIKEKKKVKLILFQIHKTENAHELELERNKISPYWDFTKSLIENARQMGITLKGKNLELFKEFKTLFGEDVLAADLNNFLNLAKEKGKGIPYVIGCLKNKIIDHTQVRISYQSDKDERLSGGRLDTPKSFGQILEGLKK